MRVFITGGGGFLGSEIVRQLRSRGDEVVSYSRKAYEHLDGLQVQQVQGDLVDLDRLRLGMKRCDAVIHTAAKAGFWGPYVEYEKTNILGTNAVLQACLDNKIQRLVFTSSPSVIHTGEDLEGIDESVPIGNHFQANYPRTKAEAEKIVTASNGDLLATVSLRPHLIWGPNDPHLVPRILDRARKGRLKRIGRADKLVDTVHVQNAAKAHVLALDRLFIGSEIAGKAYFISQDEPMPIWEFINRILEAHDIQPITRTIPTSLPWLVGLGCEVAWTLLPLRGEPPMTRFVASQLSTAHWFNLAAAKKDLGYIPEISITQGLNELRKLHLQQERPH
jgi:2-alkyl-3-oxoalkanoate reductase